MEGWTEADTATYQALGSVAVPRRDEMMSTLVSLVPFEPDAAFRIVEIGAGEGDLAARLLHAFPRATLLGLDGSPSMRDAMTRRLAWCAERARVRPFDLLSLDWWDLMHGAGLVVSSLCLHHLNDAKKQYLYKAVAERLSPGGAFLVADLIAPVHHVAKRVAADAWDEGARAQADAIGQPQALAAFVDAKWNCFRVPDRADQPAALFHQLVWLKHAGFPAVDCFWMFAGHAVFGAFK